jgi:hypothetical protein
VSIRSCHPAPKSPHDDQTPGTGSRVARYAKTWTTGKIPADLVDRSVRRLGIFGLLSALAHPLLYFSIRAVLPADILETLPPPPSFVLAMWSAIICGLIISALAFSRKLEAPLMLDIGLIFEVAGAFLIGLMQSSLYPANILVHTGIAGITLWVAFFVLVVPSSPGKTAVAALLSALMGPVSVVVASYANNRPAPPPYLFFVVFFPTLMGAAFAIILARFVYSLGHDVQKAREMGSYKLVELLGRGAMGEVWTARHRLLARPAAIKLIQPEVLGCSNPSETASMKRRFEREAQATAMLSSPHTIHLYDFGLTEDGAFYYVMELLRGLDLETLVEKYGPVPADRASHFLVQISASLEEAHRNGLVHRDIKPANIYTCRYGLECDFVKVLDFGVVRSKEDSMRPDQTTDATTGTPGFMAPEIALGSKDIDGRADIYGMGCVAYWLLTGRLVFEEDSFIATLLAHAHKAPVPPSRRSEIQIPTALEELIMACLEKDPRHRPSDAAEIIRAIAQGGLADSWTPERAEKWWGTHVPEKAGPVHGVETAQRVLQDDVQAS